MNANTTTEDLLRDRKFFRCMRQVGTPVLRKAVCVRRQKEVEKCDAEGKDPSSQSLDLCRECDQGRSIRDEVGDVEVVLCHVAECDRRAQCRGFCMKHYHEWRAGKLDGFPPWTPSGETSRPSPEPNEGDPGMIVCERCNEPKSEGEFQKNHKAPEGRLRICRTCMGKLTAQGKGAGKEKENTMAKKPNGTMTVDLGRYPEVLEVLPDAAHKRIRTPEEQVIAYVIRGLKADGYTDAQDIKE